MQMRLAEGEDMNTPWPADPDGDLTPILEASITALEAKMDAMARHPSAGGPSPGAHLTSVDRCDSCNAAAAYRVNKNALTLDLCVHHFRKNFPLMAETGWVVIGGNPDIVAATRASEARPRG